MLELEIKDKVYPFKFGVGFLKRANQRYKETQMSTMTSVEAGFEYLLARAEAGQVDAMVEILLMANKGLRPAITESVLEDYIDEEADVDALWDEVISFLESSAACKKLTKKILAASRPAPAAKNEEV